MRSDLLVVGAGPSGTMAALAAARGGLRVAVLEKRRTIGEPVQCAEGVSHFALESNGLRPDPRFVRQHVRGAKAVMPNGRRFTITRLPGYAVDRAEMDRTIADAAIDAGVDLHLGERVKGMTRTSDRWELRSDSKVWTAPLVIGADGPASLVARWAGLLERAEAIRAYEWRFDATDVAPPERDVFLLYFAKRYDGGYAWIFPRGNYVNVGAGGHIDAHRALVEFCRERGINPEKRRATIAGQIPYRYEFRSYASHGVAVVGDAAGVTNPLNGGGIHAALYSGRVAGELAAKERLADYDRVLRTSPFLDPLLWWMIDRIRTWDDRVLNSVGEFLEPIDWHTLSVPAGLRRMSRSPWMLTHGIDFLRLRRAMALTELYGW